MEKKFEQRQAEGPNGWTVWSVTGRIDTLTADEAYAAGEELIGLHPKTVLDMSEMEYISSAGLRVLLRLQKLAKKTGKKFSLSGASGIVKSVLEDSGINALFTVSKSLDELT